MATLTSTIEQANKAENSESYFSAAIYYKKGLDLAIESNDSRLIRLCRTKIVEMNKKSFESGKDFKEFEFSTNITDEEQEGIKKLIESIINLGDLNKILKIIGQNPHFCPDIDETQRQSTKTIPIFSIIGTSSTLSPEGHILRGSSNPQYSWFTEMYGINQKLIMDMYLNRIFYMLIKSKKLTIRTLSKYFSDSKLLEEDRLKLISVGLERYFKEDYVSSLHILVPQFEAFLLNVAYKFNLNVVAHDKKGEDISTRTITLSEIHLDDEEFNKVFGKNFCRQVKFILFEQMGYKLRHKIAHGEIRVGECNFQNTTLILYLYLYLLGRFKIEEKMK